MQVVELALVAPVGGVERVNLRHEHAHALVVRGLLALYALNIVLQLLDVRRVVDATAQGIHERV